MPLPVRLFAVALLLVVAACETSTSQDDAAAVDSTSAEVVAPEAEEEPVDYEVFLTGALADTLRGNAYFGSVLDTGKGKREVVIELETGSDFTGGFFITRGDTVMPGRGTLELTDTADEKGVPRSGAYRVMYREGLLRQLRSTGGTLSFEVVTDTLIQGTFDVMLEGAVSPGSGQPQPGQVQAQGRFSARPGAVGYIIGL